MITRRQMFSVPLLPAACALVQPHAPLPVGPPTPTGPPMPGSAGRRPLVEHEGWIVTSADRDAIVEARRQRLAAEGAAPKPALSGRAAPTQARPRRRD